MMKEHANPEPPDTVSTKDSIVGLCAKTHPEIEIAQCTATDRAKNVKSETTGNLGPEVLFEVPPTEVAFFNKPTYKV